MTNSPPVSVRLAVPGRRTALPWKWRRPVLAASGLLAALALAACSKLFPPPERPSTDGYRAEMRGEVDGKPFLARFALRKGLARRESGNPGARRIVILRPDRNLVSELEEATRTARLRPILPGETIRDSYGSYPFDPIRFDAFTLEMFGSRHAGFHVSKTRLSDAAVGFHPCDLLQLDRVDNQGNGASETWFFARDLDGLVVRREVKTIEKGLWGRSVEWDELSDIKIGAPASLFEIPEGWRIVTEREGRTRSPGPPRSEGGDP